MSKINIRTTIISNDKEETKELPGIINDNILKYINDSHRVSFDYNTNTLINENDETRLEIRFDRDNTISELQHKPTNTKVKLGIKTEKIEINDYNIDIEYIVLESNEKYNYRIEVI